MFKFYCLHCGQHISADESIGGTDVKCPTCGKQFVAPHPLSASPPEAPSTPVPALKPPQRSQPIMTAGTPKQWAVVGGVACAVLLLLGFFHIVRDDSGAPAAIVAKEHFTYSMTIVSVDDVLSQYNDRSVGQAMRGNPLLDHLVDELSRKGIVSQHKRTWSEIQERVRRDLPDK